MLECVFFSNHDYEDMNVDKLMANLHNVGETLTHSRSP